MRPNAVQEASAIAASNKSKSKIINLKSKILFILLLLSISGFAKKSAQQLSVEQENQFLYYFYASREAINQQNYAKALVLLEFCEQLNPNDGLVKDNLGVIFVALGYIQEAEELFAEAYRLAPDECWSHYADHLMASGQPGAAKKALKVAEDIHKRRPKDAKTAEYLLQIYMHEAMWKQALELQDKIDALVGYSAGSALNRYRIYFQWNKPDKGIAEIDRYLEEDPTSLYFLLLRADIYISAQRYEDVFHICERIAKIFPLDEQEYALVKQNKHCAYYLSLIKSEEGDSLMNAGLLDRAYEAYETAIFLFPQNIYALNNYAYNLAVHGGDIKKAERMSEATIKEEPDNPIYLDTYGWILYLQGQESLALFYLRKALENVKDEPNRAVILEHINRIVEK